MVRYFIQINIISYRNNKFSDEGLERLTKSILVLKNLSEVHLDFQS